VIPYPIPVHDLSAAATTIQRRTLSTPIRSPVAITFANAVGVPALRLTATTPNQALSRRS
jgi:hypothetical protein